MAGRTVSWPARVGASLRTARGGRMTRPYRNRKPGRWQFLYDGRTLHATIELRDDGLWHVLMHGRDEVGAFATREMAIGFANGRQANIPAAPVVGERIADAKRVNQINRHRRVERHRQQKRTERRRL